MESWSIELEKEYFKFSAAHFLIFPDGSAERLHGHNYRVFIEVDASLSEHGLVIDFKEIRYLDRYYAAPAEDVLVLPMNNTSSENLASWIGREVLRLLTERFGEVQTRELRVAVEETSGQRGVYRYQD